MPSINGVSNIGINSVLLSIGTSTDLRANSFVDAAGDLRTDINNAAVTSVADVPGLETALAGKQSTLVGTADVPGLDTALAGKQSTLVGTADVPGLDTALAGKQSVLTGTTDVPGLDTALAGKQSVLTGTTDVPGLDTALAGKQSVLTGTTDVPGLDTALAGKQSVLTGTTDVPGLDTALAGKQSVLTGTTDVPGLDTALAGKQSVLTGTTDVPGLDTALAGKQSTLVGTADVPGLDTALAAAHVTNVMIAHSTNRTAANGNSWGTTSASNLTNPSYIRLWGSNGRVRIGNSFMSQNTGVFTFSTAGIYKITVHCSGENRNVNDRLTVGIYTSINDAETSFVPLAYTATNPTLGGRFGLMYLRDDNFGVGGQCSFSDYYVIAQNDTLRIKVRVGLGSDNRNYNDVRLQDDFALYSTLIVERISGDSSLDTW